jgi:chromosome segregation ATPase
MSSSHFKQAEKEIRAFRAAAEGVKPDDPRSIKKLIQCAQAIKGTTAVDEAMTELGSLQRVADEKRREIAALEAEANRHAEKIAATEDECVRVRVKAETELARIADQASAARAELVKAQAELKTVSDERAALQAEIDRIKAKFA